MPTESRARCAGCSTSPGRTNDFRRLPHPLFIGATDQDRRIHVLFGDEEHDDVPVSLAVQASLSFNPAFRATRIGDHFYEDGGVTRTSNFIEAIERGADLVFVVDPQLPYVAKEPGDAQARGLLYNVDQNIRAISYTRYAIARDHVLRRHPQVSFYDFLPANRLRRLMSVNPLDHRPYLEIWRGAYLSTLRQIERLGYRLAGDLDAHGIPLTLERAIGVARQLRGGEPITFAEFFPERQVELQLPPAPLPPEEAAVQPVTPVSEAPPGAA